ncbi:MAG: hypothetical protein FH761_04235 [Firmicutes bacterium]|nr:hypothetical protein [Bacillota bacterium]
MRRGDYITGIILIIIGGVFLLNNFDIIQFDIELHWPLFLLVPGLIFEISYFIRRKDPGLLVPGGILTIYGLYFYAIEMDAIGNLVESWAVYPLGVAIGLFQLFIFGGRERGLLFPVGILTIVSLFGLSSSFDILSFNLILGVAFVLFGLYILLKRK